MKYKAVFFDIDGTLIPLDSVARCLRDTLKYFNLKPLTLKKIKEKTIGYRIKEGVPQVYPETKRYINKFYHQYQKLYLKNFEKYTQLLPHVKRTFNYLYKTDVKIGIVTTKGRKRALAVLKNFNLNYNVLVSSDDVKHRKPHPEPVLKACKKLKVKPKECIFFGDHEFDMRAGKSAGCTSVGVLTGHTGRKQLKKSGADFIIRNLKAVRKFIK